MPPLVPHGTHRTPIRLGRRDMRRLALHPLSRRIRHSDRRDGPRSLGDSPRSPRPVRGAVCRSRHRRSRLRSPWLRGQHGRARPVPSCAPARRLARSRCLRSLTPHDRCRAGGDLRIVDGRWKRSCRGRRRPACRRCGQPGSVPRHLAPGCPLIAFGLRAASCSPPSAVGTCPRSDSQAKRHSSTHRTARPAGAASSPPARTRAGEIASRRAGCSAAPIVRPATPVRCTARGSCASAELTVSPSPDRPSPPHAAPRSASSGPTRASTTSTSTTARNTRRYSPTRSTSSAAISCSPELGPGARIGSERTPRALARYAGASACSAAASRAGGTSASCRRRAASR